MLKLCVLGSGISYTLSPVIHKAVLGKLGVPAEYGVLDVPESGFDAAVREFARLLKPGGYFMALWNTRYYESNPLLVEIEDYLHKLAPDMKRVSSGRSEFCNGLTERLSSRTEFSEVVYLEGRHIEQQTPQRYLGLWESVNDVRVQLGEDRFAQFLDYIREKTSGLAFIEAEYLTRAWIARRAG